jgi:capsular polysaccharide transport system permease protein
MPSSGKSSPSGLAKRLRGLNSLFTYTVVLPTLLSALYFGPIASNIYTSESRLVLRTPEKQQSSSSGVSALLQGAGGAAAGGSHSQADPYSVMSFILSRDALKQLNDELHLDKKFGSKDVDIVKRFAGLDWWNNSFESLYYYYTGNIVLVVVDPLSSIVTVTVTAFNPDDAYQIDERLVKMSEELINKINERLRQDLIRFATVDVEIAQKKAEEAILAVAQYRNQKSVFDPTQQSPLHLNFMVQLEDALIAAKTQYEQIAALSPDNPQLPTLKLKINTLQDAINEQSSRLTGSGKSLSSKAADYDRLVFQQTFTQQQLASTQQSLEQARNEARRKQVYIERLVQPSKPDYATLPKRLRGIFATLVLGIIAWGILTILLAGVREHRD